jgi:hypothetical protein
MDISKEVGYNVEEGEMHVVQKHAMYIGPHGIG